MKKLTLLALSLCLPALAQAPQFHVALSGQFGNFTGLTEGLAVLGRDNTPGALGYGAAPVTYDMKSKTPLQLDLGVTHGDDDFTLSYWSGKAQGNGSFTAPPTSSNLYYYSPYGDYLNQLGMSNGTSEVKAHTLDIAWTRTFVKNDKGSLAFSFGLREFKVERAMFLDQWGIGAPPLPHMGNDQLSATSKGFGLLAGLSGRYTLTDRVWLTGGMKFAMTDGKNDFNYTQTYDPAFNPGRRNPYLQVALEGQKQTSLQMDMDLKLNVNFVAGFDGFVGYQMKSFRDVLGNDAGGAYGRNTISSDAPRTIGFNGVVVGVAYRF